MPTKHTRAYIEFNIERVNQRDRGTYLNWRKEDLEVARERKNEGLVGSCNNTRMQPVNGEQREKHIGLSEVVAPLLNEMQQG